MIARRQAGNVTAVSLLNVLVGLSNQVLQGYGVSGDILLRNRKDPPLGLVKRLTDFAALAICVVKYPAGHADKLTQEHLFFNNPRIVLDVHR